MNGALSPPRRGELLLLAIILLLAGALRLGAPGITEFKRDEANLSRLALDLARGRDLPLLGITSSVNVPNPPISAYLLALPYLVDDSPLAATLFVGALNVIAVGLAWWLARRYYGPFAAFVAALLYAASPWAVIYSRKIWAQDLLPPFVLATVITGLLGYAEGRRWARLVTWPLLAITVQIHYGAFVLVPLSLVIIGLWWRRVVWRDLWIGLALAALTAVPALAGAYRDGWLSPSAIQERVQTSEEHLRVISSTALDDAWFMVAGTNIHSLAGPQAFRDYLDSVPDAWNLFKLVPLGAAASVAGLLWHAARRRTWASVDVVLAVWIVLPVVAFTWEWTKVVPHYMIPLLPAAYSACGAGAAVLGRLAHREKIHRAVQIAIGGLVVVIAGFQVFNVVALLHFVDENATPGGFGTPLHYLLDVRDAVLSRAPDDVIVVGTEELAPYEQDPAVWGVLLDPVPHVRFVNGTHTAVLPAGDALELVIWTPGLRTCPDDACWREGSSQVFEQRPGEAPLILRPARHSMPLAAVTALPSPVRFANGALLTGYAIKAGGVALVWQLPGPVAADYQAFIHALDAEGKRLTQQDRFSWPGRYWRAGDTLVLWFDLLLPLDTTVLYTGLYTTDGITYENVEVVDDTGAVLAYGATIALAD